MMFFGLITILFSIPGSAINTNVTYQVAKLNDTVQVYYSLSYPGGRVFESNRNSSPLTFVLGSGAMITGFDKSIRGMKTGETKTVILKPDAAYGEWKPGLVQTMGIREANEMFENMTTRGNISISIMPGYSSPVIEFLPNVGKRERYLCTNITNETVVVDHNKPLAGKSLQFTITLVKVGK